MKHTQAEGDGVLPWTRSCFVCGQDNPRGFRLRSRREGGLVVADYTTRATDQGWRGVVHGGITMSLMDEVMTWAAIIACGAPCLAAEMSTRLKKPVPVDCRLRAEAGVTAKRTRLLLTEARVLDAQGALLATATGKYMPLPASSLDAFADDFVPAPEALPLPITGACSQR